MKYSLQIFLQDMDLFFRKTEDVRQILKIFVPMVQSGRMELVRTVRQVMIAMKESKSLNWKVCVILCRKKQTTPAYSQV